MDVMTRGMGSSLNPNAAPYVPGAGYREVEDYSPEWWALVRFSPWFRDYWLRECFDEDDDGEIPIVSDLGEDDFVDALPDDLEILLSDSALTPLHHKEERERKEVVTWGAEKWRATRGRSDGARYGEKAPKIVSGKVSPRAIQQPR